MDLDLKALDPAPDANKYTRGKLTVVAGSDRYPGAAVLAARASQRAGAGYTEVVTAPSAVDVVRLSSPSLVVRPLDEWSASELPASDSRKPCAVCLGPGFTGDEAEGDVVTSILKHAACPVLVDGGALASLLSMKALKRLAKRADRGLPTVVTPHGGEAVRLARPFKLPTGDPEKLASGLSLALHAIVVLKGPDTYIADGSRVVSMREGTSALAKAGTGDVLAGMIAALLAQGMEPVQAAYTGCILHARAGIAAANRLTDVCVTAEDVIEYIPEALLAQNESQDASATHLPE